MAEIEKLIVVWGNQIGMPHKRNGTNNMDAYAVERSRGCIICGIADGSGGTGVYSETYARIMINWLTLRARILVENMGSRYSGVDSISAMADQLWSEYQKNLNNHLNLAFDGISSDVINEIVEKQDDRNRKLKYVDEFMLHTALLLIIILNEKTGNWDAYLLYKGDGFIVRNESVMNVDKIITPKHTGVMYPALGLSVYQGILRPENEKTARAGFEFVTLGSSGDKWNRLAVASDGLRYVMPDMYEAIIFPYYNTNLDQKDRDNSIGIAMQWAIKDRRFSPDDDLAIVSVMTQSYIDEVNRSIERAIEAQAKIAQETLDKAFIPVEQTPDAKDTTVDNVTTELDLPPVIDDSNGELEEGSHHDG